MSGWDRDAIDLVEPGFIEFARDGAGEFGFIAVRGWLDCRRVERDGRVGLEFTWEGVDEGDQVNGRGWAILNTGSTVGSVADDPQPAKTDDLTEELASLRALTARLRTENTRLLRLLELTPKQTTPPGPGQTGFFEAPPVRSTGNRSRS